MDLYKRITAMLMAAAMCLAMLSGCGGAAKVEQPVENADNNAASPVVSVDDMYSQIDALGILPDMYILDDAYISGYYGISEDSISEKIFAVADDSLKADTIIIVKATDDSKAAEIVDSFVRINNQRMAELESYNPEQYDRVEKAVIEKSGSCVYYIVSDDNNAVVQIIESSI